MSKAKTRKIIPPRETLEFEVGTITLMPVRFEFFDSMTEIVNKYFGSFVEGSNKYAALHAEVLDKYDDPAKQNLAIAALNESFDAGLEIGKSMLKTSSDAANDARLIIEASIDPNAEITVNLEELTAVEIMMLLGAAIQLNINFFKDHQDVMGISTLLNTKAEGRGQKAEGRGQKAEETVSKPTGEKLPAG
ncbi:MAG: hypothetical protein AAFQ41_00400 [Cyanobacteria bacterium J06623_7]